MKCYDIIFKKHHFMKVVKQVRGKNQINEIHKQQQKMNGTTLCGVFY